MRPLHVRVRCHATICSSFRFVCWPHRICMYTPAPPSRQVVVPLPDEEARAAILGVHLRRVPLASQHDRDLACEAVGKITAGARRGEPRSALEYWEACRAGASCKARPV